MDEMSWLGTAEHRRKLAGNCGKTQVSYLEDIS